jgi:hypothetical protein
MYKKHFLKIFLVLLFLPQNLFAADLLNVGLRVDMRYETFGEACHLRGLFRHYDLSMEIKNNEVSRAKLTKLNTFGPSIAHSINKQDAATFDVRTEGGLSWIKSFSASPEIITKLINTAEGLGKEDSCQPPTDFISDNLQPVYFDFDVEEVSYLLPHLINSKPVVLQGHGANAEPFRIVITLIQDRT